MKFEGIAMGSIFVFKGEEDYPYLKGPDHKYFDPIDQVQQIHDDGRDVLPIDISLLFRYAAKNDIQQFVVEERIARYLKEVQAPKVDNSEDDFEAKIEYIFKCAQCHKPRRKSYFLDKAKVKICRKCRRQNDQTKDQIPLFREGAS